MELMLAGGFILLVAVAVPHAMSSPGRRTPEGRMDVDYSMEVVTPHVKWANPYGGGTIRAYLVPSILGGRDVIEIAQRLALEYDTLTLETGGYNAWGLGDFYAKRGGAFGRTYEKELVYLTEDLQSGVHYDAIVLPGTHAWDTLPEAARAALVDRVSEGCGLVLVAPGCGLDRLAEFSQLSPLIPSPGISTPERKQSARAPTGAWRPGGAHYITDNVPLALLPFDQMGHRQYQAAGDVLLECEGHPILAVKTCGRGRVVALGYENFGFSPRIDNPWRVDTECHYWEYYYSLLCRAMVWAAGRESQLRLTGMEVDSDALRVTLKGVAEAAAVEVTLRDERYQVEAELREEAAASDRTVHVAVNLPGGLSGGPHFADVIVRAPGGTLDWGTCTFLVPQEVVVAELQLAQDVVTVGDTLAGEARLRAPSPTRVTIRLSFEDNRGRRLHSESRELTVVGEMAAPFSVGTAHCLTRLGRAVCEVHGGNGRIARKVAPVFVRIPQVWDDYEVLMTRFLPEPAPGRWPTVEERFEEMGVSALGAISAAMAEHTNLKIQADVVSYGFHPDHHQPQYGKMKQAYLDTREKTHLVREPCYSDPAYRARLREELRSKVSRFARFSPLSYYAYEEPSLTHYRDCLDICWSPSCLSGLRDWLRGSYSSLPALNEEWGTDFDSWDDVLPSTAEEAQASGNYAPWADHRTWMETMWADLLREGRDVISGIDPKAVVCLSGNQESNPYNGYDYSRLNQYLGQIQQYTGGNLEEFSRSLSPDLRPTICTGYGITDPDLSLQLWGQLLNGNTAGSAIFWEISCLNPDLTLSKSGRDQARHFAELRAGGIARLLRTAKRSNCGIAIHYSYPSIHGMWITDGNIVDGGTSRALELFNHDRIAWTRVLEGLGLQYDFVSYRQVEEGALLAGGYRVLVMPTSVAVSDREAEEIERFIRSGGVLIADIWPAVMDEHCKWRKGGRLDSIFGIAQGPVQPGDVRLPEAWSHVEAADAEQEWCADDARVTRQAYGEGKAMYLGFSLSPIVRDWVPGMEVELARAVAVVSSMLREAGVAAPVQISDEHSRSVLTCESAWYDAEGVSYLGVVRYRAAADGKTEQSHEVAPIEDVRGSLGKEGERLWISFPYVRHVYDVRRKTYLGHTDRVEVSLGYGDAALFALLPYQVVGVEVTAPDRVSPGEAADFRVNIRKRGGGRLGNHTAIAVLRAPDGSEPTHYCHPIDLTLGVGESAVPLALNDSVGEWQIVVRDVATGVEGSTSFRLQVGDP